MADDSALLFGSLLFAGAAKLGMVYWAQKNAKKNLEKVGEVSTIYLHPIKSCRGLSLSEANCTKLGLECNDVRDRFFMIIDENDRFVTVRQEPSMVLITPSIHGPNLYVDAPDMETLVIPKTVMFDKDKLVMTKVWGQEAVGTDLGEKAAAWINKYFNGKGYRIIYASDDLPMREPRDIPSCVSDNQIAYSDSTPYMLLTNSSLADINEKLNRNPAVQMRNFRPGIVVTTDGPPFDEDDWEEIYIGDVHLFNYFACVRCPLITFDPDTGVKDSNQEPLKTLKGYRIKEKFHKSSPCFGVKLGAAKTGRICVGDEVYVKRFTKEK